MIDFEITQEEFARASRQMTRARTAPPNEVIDLTCYTGSIRFLVTGREYTATASVEGKGLAQFPLSLLPKLRKVASTFNEKPLRIRIENGRIRINSMSLASERITEKKITDRAIDIPEDASIRDILALLNIFTAEEVTASDLHLRYLAANSEKIKTIDSAASTLAKFGITTDSIEAMVNEAVRRHAERLRPMLKPELISGRPN